MQRKSWLVLVLFWFLATAASVSAETKGLVGHWKLRGDCRDHSGNGNHGVNHGVKLEDGTFNGINAYVEVPSTPSLQLGTKDFTVAAWVYTEQELDDVIGDVLSKFDAQKRRGISLAMNSGAGGYQGQGSDHQVYFGIDNSQITDWQDCGRPNATSNYISNSLTVYKGKLYAANTDASDESEWCHVYRYEGNQQWVDCGRVGKGRTTGVGPLIVHNGNLYAVTTTYDWTRIRSGKYDPGRVYRYEGGTSWKDLGEPSDDRTLTTAVSYQGKLYVGGGPETWGVFVQDGPESWSPSKIFEKRGPRKCFPHSMSRYNGKMYVGYPSVYAFDGKDWTYAGVPSPPENILQTHALAVYQGNLIAGTWPYAKVARYQGGEQWEEIGRIGNDGTEVMDLIVYNGKLYGCSIPRAEVCRYDDQPEWASLKRFYSPEGWIPVSPTEHNDKTATGDLNEWTRVTSLTIYNGKLFASIGSCTSSILDAPADVRGKVFCMEAGKCVSSDNDLGPGWKHLVAVRTGNRLKLYVDGVPTAESSEFDPATYDISNEKPLQIGFGQTDYFAGKMSDVRIYNRSLTNEEIHQLAQTIPKS